GLLLPRQRGPRGGRRRRAAACVRPEERLRVLHEGAVHELRGRVSRGAGGACLEPCERADGGTDAVRARLGGRDDGPVAAGQPATESMTMQEETRWLRG